MERGKIRTIEEIIKLTPEQQEKAESISNRQKAFELAIEKLALSALKVQKELWNYISDICPQTLDDSASYDSKEGVVTIQKCDCPKCRKDREQKMISMN